MRKEFERRKREWIPDRYIQEGQGKEMPRYVKNDRKGRKR